MHTALWRDSVYFEVNRSFSFSESSATGLHAFWHLTLLNGLIPRSVLSNSTATLLAPAWSISLEWQYYLAAPFIARLVRSGFGWVFLTGLAWVGLRSADLWINPHLAFLPAQLPLFLIGIGSYHLYQKIDRFSGRQSSVGMLIIGLLLAISILKSWHASALIGWTVAFGCIVLRGNDPLSRTLSVLRGFLLHRWLQYLGKISYPVYLVHWPFIVMFLALLLNWNPGISSPFALLITLSLGLPVILLTANLLHIMVECPMMKLGKQLSRRTLAVGAVPEPG